MPFRHERIRQERRASCVQGQLQDIEGAVDSLGSVPCVIRANEMLGGLPDERAVVIMVAYLARALFDTASADDVERVMREAAAARDKVKAAEAKEEAAVAAATAKAAEDLAAKNAAREAALAAREAEAERLAAAEKAEAEAKAEAERLAAERIDTCF